MLRRAAVAVFLLGSNLLSGCAAHQARTAGGTIGILGGATTIVGVGVATGCEPFSDDEETTCQTDTWEPDPVTGLQVAGVGLFMLGLGALLYAAGAHDSNWSSSSSSSSSATPTPPPEEPAPSSGW